MTLRKVSSPSRRASTASSGSERSEIVAKPDLSEGDIQKLLREADPGMGFVKLVKFTRLAEVGTAGIFEAENNERAIFAVDKASHELIWIEDIEPVVAHAAAPVATVTPSITTSESSPPDEGPDEANMHPVAKAYTKLSEGEQKSYWQNINYLTVPYGPERNITCKLIGFQNMDAGPIGGIFADEHNGRHLFCISFKTGVPFRLGQPRPPRRP